MGRAYGGIAYRGEKVGAQKGFQGKREERMRGEASARGGAREADLEGRGGARRGGGRGPAPPSIPWTGLPLTELRWWLVLAVESLQIPGSGPLLSPGPGPLTPVPVSPSVPSGPPALPLRVPLGTPSHPGPPQTRSLPAPPPRVPSRLPAPGLTEAEWALSSRPCPGRPASSEDLDIHLDRNPPKSFYF